MKSNKRSFTPQPPELRTTFVCLGSIGGSTVVWQFPGEVSSSAAQRVLLSTTMLRAWKMCSLGVPVRKENI